MGETCRDYIGSILKEDWDRKERKAAVCALLTVADCMGVKPYDATELPKEILEDYYDITATVNYEVLGDMTQAQAYHWLESLRICAFRQQKKECDGIPQAKSDPNSRPCIICMKDRAISIGLLLGAGELSDTSKEGGVT